MVDTSIERFRRVVQAAYAELASRRQEVNDLNVFPVADGDTGDNMALTMQAVMKELDRLDGQPVPADRDELVHAVARAALMGARGNSGVILSQIVRGAAEELASRPGELVDPVLVPAGVVAGLRDDTEALPELPHHEPARATRPHHFDSRFRYCTNFIVTGSGLDSRSFVPRLEEIGDSVLVVGDEATLKVHVHTDEPEVAVAAFEEAGDVQRLDVADMREQIAAREARLRPAVTGAVAVAAGDGMRTLFEGLGAHVVDGGSTFNPSTYEILAGIHEVPAEEVLVLPNSPNVILAATEAANLSEKPARVVPSRSQQAAPTALVEPDPGADAEANAERLRLAMAAVRSGA